MAGKKKKKGGKGQAKKAEAAAAAPPEQEVEESLEDLSLAEAPSQPSEAEVKGHAPKEEEKPPRSLPAEKMQERPPPPPSARQRPETPMEASAAEPAPTPSPVHTPGGVIPKVRSGPFGRGRGRGRGRSTEGELMAPHGLVSAAAEATPEPVVYQKQPPAPTTSPALAMSPSKAQFPALQPKPAEMPPVQRPGVASQPPKVPVSTPPSGSPAKKPVPQKLPIEPLQQQLPPTTGKQYEPIPRPDYGKRGRPIELRANFFKMKVDPNITIYHYDIAAKPELKSKVKMRALVDAFAENNPNLLRKTLYVFDGRKNFYTPSRLPFQNKVEFDVQLPDDRPAAPPIKISIQLANTISLESFVRFFNGTLRSFPQESVQALDIVARGMPTKCFIPLNQYFFTNPASVSLNLGPGLELWNGFYQSVRPAWKVTMLNVDSSVRVFHKGQTVIELLKEVSGLEVSPSTELNPAQWTAFASHIKGLQVEVNTEEYPMLAKRTYRIIALSRQPCSQQVFPMSQPDGTERSCIVLNYFRDMYNLNLRYPKLHCLQAQPEEKHRYIPMEICVVKKGQQLKKLSDVMTAQIIKHSAVPAPERERQILEIMRNSNYDKDPILKNFGMSVSKEMTELTGRILPAPAIQYGQRETVPVREGSWNMQRVKFFDGVRVSMMALICFDRSVRDDSLRGFLKDLCREANKTGMSFPVEGEVAGMPLLRGMSARDVERLMIDLHEEYRQKLQLIIAVLPLKNDDIYGEIKKVGDLDLGIPTQCVLSKNVKYCKPQTLVNICQKINAKLGGVNAVIKMEELSKIMNEPVIIMGADVTHPSPGDTETPSIAAVTASFDRFGFKYTARISMQQHRKEIIVDLRSITRDLLMNFRGKTNQVPKKIIFYRDGVSEGQFREVLASELQAIQQACFSLSDKYKPMVTFIVVQKRHHTRLFCKNERDRVGRSGNVPAGTTVDTVITHPIEFDFYLCSHYGIQGTSKPAHYYVLYDDSSFSSDAIQELTYQMCHVYSRCTRSVSIPTPAYYAHLCAFRGRYYYDRFIQNRITPTNEQLASRALQENYKGMFFA